MATTRKGKPKRKDKKRKAPAETKAATASSTPGVGWIRLEDAEAMAKDAVEKSIERRGIYGTPDTLRAETEARRILSLARREHQDTRDERDGLLALIAIAQRTGGLNRIAQRKEGD